MSKRVPHRRRSQPSKGRQTSLTMRSDERPTEGAWAEFCWDPTCPCYGVTIHRDGVSEHRPWTALELLENAGVVLRGHR